MRDLALNPRRQVREIAALIQTQAHHHVLDDSFWPWYQANFTTLQNRLSAMSPGRLVDSGARHRRSIADIAPFQQFIGARVDTIATGPRALRQAIENIGICAAIAAHHVGARLSLTNPS